MGGGKIAAYATTGLYQGFAAPGSSSLSLNLNKGSYTIFLALVNNRIKNNSFQINPTKYSENYEQVFTFANPNQGIAKLGYVDLQEDEVLAFNFWASGVAGQHYENMVCMAVAFK